MSWITPEKDFQNRKFGHRLMTNEEYSVKFDNSSNKKGQLSKRQQAENLIKSLKIFDTPNDCCNQAANQCKCKVTPMMVFHCEFSQKRGPRMFEYAKEIDHSQSFGQNLSFPHMFLLNKGYERFWNTFPELCCPEDCYTSMFGDSDSKSRRSGRNDCEKEWKMIECDGKNAKKNSRNFFNNLEFDDHKPRSYVSQTLNF